MRLFISISLNLAAALVAAAVLCAPAMADEPMVLDRIVAVVNNEAITWIELYEDMRRDLAPTLSKLDEDAKRNLLKQAESSSLERLIVKRVQLQRAEDLGMTATDMDVDAALRNIRTKYSIDEDSFRAALSSEGLSWEQYRLVLAEQITLSRLVDRDVRAAMEDDAAALKREAQRMGIKSSRYRIRQIFIRFAEDGSNVEDVKWKLKRVYEDLGAGRDFSAVATSYSEGPTARDGGDLGFIAEDEMSDLFRQHVLGLAPGRFTDPIQTNTGVHVLMLQEKLEPEQYVMQQAMDKALQRWLGGLLDSAYIDVRL